jgi:2-phosphosulfolactate phosphatase
MNAGPSTALEVLFAPAEFDALAARDLSRTVCVVFDVLRATSSMVTALGNGAAAIIPTAEIAEALQVRQQQPEVLLAGERDGVRILASQTGSISFDLGNSPREFTRNVVAGRTIVMTTTNGTRALRACAKARQILLGSFLNLGATADFLLRIKAESLLLVCGGTFEQAAAEDALGAGALCELVWNQYGAGAVADSAFMVRSLYDLAKNDLTAAFSQTRNGRRLCSRPDLREDVPFCARRDVFRLAAEMSPDGAVRVCGARQPTT